MKTIERLRELLAKATGPYDSKVDPWMDQRFKARDECLDALPALLAVVEAAEKVRLAFTEDADGELRFVGLDRATQSIREVNAALRAMEGGSHE